MLGTLFHRADETTVQRTYASVQQLLETMETHLGPTLNTRPDHPDNREGAEASPRPEDVNLEEVSIHFLRRYSVHSNWKQIISSCNDYGQTMAHISVTLGYLRLLRHLFTWGIDLNVVGSMGSTALHYAYLYKQEDCTKFLIQSGVNQFILDDLGRSPSDLDPSLEVGFDSNIDTDSDSHADGALPIEYDTKMQDKVEKLHATHFWVQQWMRRDEGERWDEVPPSRNRSPQNWGGPRMAGRPPAMDSTDERDWGVTYDSFPSLGVRIPEENTTHIAAIGAGSRLHTPKEMDLEVTTEITIALPPPAISEASIQSQEADRPSDISQDTYSHLAPLGGAINTPGP